MSAFLPTTRARFADSVTGGSIAVDSRGAFAAVGGPRGVVLIDLEWPWEPCRTVRLSVVPEAVTALEWHPMPSREGILACAGERGSITICDIVAMEPSAKSQLSILRHPAAGVPAAGALGWCPEDANSLATRSVDGAVAVWDIRVARGRASLNLGAAEARLGGCIHLRAGDRLSGPLMSAGVCGALCWDPLDPCQLACSQGGQLELWDIRRAQDPPRGRVVPPQDSATSFFLFRDLGEFRKELTLSSTHSV